MANKTWDGGGADNNWGTKENWAGDVAPTAGDALFFGGTTQLTNVNNIAADTSFASITFNAGAGAFVISGNRITLAGTLTNSSSNEQTLSLNIIISALRSFTGSSGGTTLSGVISGAGGINKEGSNVLTISGTSNSYTGKVVLVQGLLDYKSIANVSGGNSSLGAPTTSANGTIELQGFSPTLRYSGTGDTTNRIIYLNAASGSLYIDQSGASGNLNFTSALQLSNGAKTMVLQGSTNGTGEFSGLIANTPAGALSVTKTGTGVWTLSTATNTYTGALTINEGMLLVNGSNHASSAVAVNNTGTLGGTGTVNGAITVAAGGTIAPGNGDANIGTLNTAAVTFNATSTYSVDLNGTTPTADKISSSGTVTCAGTLTIASIINSIYGKIYTIVGAATISGTFAGLTEGATFTSGINTFQISYLSNNVTLTDKTVGALVGDSSLVGDSVLVGNSNLVN